MANEFEEEFESVSGQNSVWNPTIDENKDPKSEAGDDDFITGYYHNRKDGVGQHKATVHVLEKKDGTKVDIWGSKMLNEELDKVNFGDFIRIKWLGKFLTKAGAEKTEKKRTSLDSFHKWEVLVSKTTPPKQGGQRVSAPAAPSTKPMNEAPTTNAAKAVVQDDDDLPF